MYTINIDNRPLYNPLNNDLALLSPELEEKASKAGMLRFTVPPTHAEYNNFVKLKTVCSVYRDGGAYPVWRGRTFYTKLNANGTLYVECEGLLAYLLDSNMRVYDYTGTLAGFVELILNTHNAQVSAAQQIRLGVVTVADDNDYIHRSSTQYISCWEAFENGLIKTHGGYVRLRYTAEGTVLDYLAGTENDLQTATQTIEYGENITDIMQEISAEETYSVCIPLGAKLAIETDTGEASEQRLTIESVNGGLDYIVNDEAFAEYGWICAPVDLTTWDDVTEASNLLRKARAFLNNTGVKLKDTISVTAIDLHNSDADIDGFRLLDRIRVQSTPHNISSIYIATERKTPLAEPTGAVLTLGGSTLTLTDAHKNEYQDAQNRIDNISGTIEADKAETNAAIGELAQTAIALESLIERTSTELTSIMSREYVRTSTFEEYMQNVSTEFKQTADSFMFNFTQITSQITTLSGETNSQFSEISKYIRFVDGNIVLGETGNVLTLRISNDRIAFLHDNVEIAYFSSNRMFVDHLEALTTLTCGNFAFTPRANGNLSLRMVAPPATQARTMWNATRTAYVWEDLSREITYYGVLLAFDRKTKVDIPEWEIAEGDSFTATVTTLPGYEIKAVYVRMGGVDISETAYSDGVIFIPQVTGDITISTQAKRTIGVAAVGEITLGGD